MTEGMDRVDFIGLCSSLSQIPLEYQDRAQALHRIVDLGRQAMGSQACVLAELDESGQVLVPVAWAGFDETVDRQVERYRIALDRGRPDGVLSYDRLIRGETIALHDIQVDGRGIILPEVARLYGLSAALCRPLLYGDRLLGSFIHFSQDSDALTLDARRLIEIFARQAVITLQLLDNLEKLVSHDRLEQLNDIMQEMTGIRTRSDLMEMILDRGLELVGCDRGWISQLDFKTGRLDIVAHRGGPLNLRPLQVGQGITGQALARGEPIRVGDVRDPRWINTYEEFWPDTRSELAVPMVISNAQARVMRDTRPGQKPIGVFNVESSVVGALSHVDENLLWSLTRHAAVLIDRIDLDGKVAKLARVQQEMIGKRDWDDIFEIMMQAITESLGYDYVNISLVDHERNRIKTEYLKGIPANEVEDFKRLADHPLEGTDIQADVVRSRQIEVPADTDSRFDPVIYRRFGHHRMIRVYVPIITPSDNRVIGTVEAGHQRTNRQYIYEQDIEILKNFINYAAAGLEQRERGVLDRITHELRSPIVGVRSNASFLQRRLRELDEELVQRKFDDMLTDCEMVLLQVKELEYMLGRPAAMPKVERTLVFRDVIIKTIRQLKPVVAQHGLDPSRIDYDPAHVRRIRPLYVDKAQLNQVVFNLLINSIKYAEDDPARFAIKIAVDQTRDGFVVIFKDWGIGIRRDLADKVFEEGFRTPEAKRKHVTGSGLGLTIARKIMREMGGDLLLAHPSKPTEFHMVLPRSLMEVPHDPRSR